MSKSSSGGNGKGGGSAVSTGGSNTGGNTGTNTGGSTSTPIKTVTTPKSVVRLDGPSGQIAGSPIGAEYRARAATGPTGQTGAVHTNQRNVGVTLNGASSGGSGSIAGESGGTTRIAPGVIVRKAGAGFSPFSAARRRANPTLNGLWRR